MAWTHLIRGACACLIACAAGLAPAQQPPSSKQAANALPPNESQARAAAVLANMARFLASAQQFSVKVGSTYDVVQPYGEKFEFAEARTVVVSRPGRLRVEADRSDGAKVLLVLTGKEIVLHDRAANVYATAPQPGDLDHAVVHLVRDLGLRLPLAVMLLSTLPEELKARVQSIDYVAHTTMHGGPAHHIIARAATADIQLWIADGAQPLPQRVVITYKKSAGQPQHRAQLTEWNLAPKLGDATFALSQPEGAQKVSFAAQLPRLTLAARAQKRQQAAK